MNPYLEQKGLWLDFHQAFCTRLRDAIVPQVRPDYFVKLEEHLYIHEVGEAERVLAGRADVGVTRSSPAPRSTVSTAATLEAPLELMVPIATDVEHVSYLEIRDRKDRTLVTVIELLSPSNKQPGDDREAFLVKRRQLLASDVHYVEIDLLRGGARMPVEPMTGCDYYYVLVGRAERRPRSGFWPLTLREPLPTIPVPVREPHPDARVDLQAILHELYDAAGYEDYIYSGLPEPRLHPDDDRWAREILAGVLPPKIA
jgi:hypothetical protein